MNQYVTGAVIKDLREKNTSFPLKSGTDRPFLSPVPGFRLNYRSARVQMATFAFLYPSRPSSAFRLVAFG